MAYRSKVKDICRSCFKKCLARIPSSFEKYIKKCISAVGIPSTVTWIFQPVMATPLDEDTQDHSENEDPEGPIDLTKITFAHGTNSKQKLRDALSNKTIDFIEADIVLGSIIGTDKTKKIPVMAHPPATTSDLALEKFLKIVQEAATKNVKLDFKSSEAFEASLDLLKDFFDNLTEPISVWLNADILPGPGARNNPGVNASLFLTASATRFPYATVSVGWTTKWSQTDNKYLSEDIDRMTEELNKHCVVSQPVTFAVRAAYAGNSVEALTNLIKSSTEGTTLTIWNSSPNDIVDMEAVDSLINAVGKDKVYLDLSPFINTGSDGSQLLSDRHRYFYCCHATLLYDYSVRNWCLIPVYICRIYYEPVSTHTSSSDA